MQWKLIIVRYAAYRMLLKIILYIINIYIWNQVMMPHKYIIRNKKNCSTHNEVEKIELLQLVSKGKIKNAPYSRYWTCKLEQFYLLRLIWSGAVLFVPKHNNWHSSNDFPIFFWVELMFKSWSTLKCRKTKKNQIRRQSKLIKYSLRIRN